MAGDACRWRVQGIRALRLWLLRGLLPGTLLLLTGCATGRIAGETYRDFEHGYEVRLPPATWIPRQMETAMLSFGSPGLGAGMALLTDCRALSRANSSGSHGTCFLASRRSGSASRNPFVSTAPWESAPGCGPGWTAYPARSRG
jgi:hypothetical protein